ncbi:hypothetical protein JOC36_001442 [Weissella uvarum]|uniref:hypothetical protein n=1 Tax=Weissella uvarum TaxID=1479233 RepID=UPI0019604458|nr:hypothetical protein [Weissella uvarum]MBM7617849.1 hypothetical protein [Weissella uvarum]MCM0596153.1 hypothetical protein [Weissella uvarum]
MKEFNRLKYYVVIAVCLIFTCMMLLSMRSDQKEHEKLNDQLGNKYQRFTKMSKMVNRGQDIKASEMNHKSIEVDLKVGELKDLVDQAAKIDQGAPDEKQSKTLDDIQTKYLHLFNKASQNKTMPVWYTKAYKQSLEIGYPSVIKPTDKTVNIPFKVKTKGTQDYVMHIVTYSFEKHKFVEDRLLNIKHDDEEAEDEE